MIINSGNLRTLYTGYSAAFQGAFAAAAPRHTRIATVVPSTAAENEYGWLGMMPQLREWIGERVVQNLATHDYRIRNKTYEVTIGVKREHIEDDQLGLYTPMFQMLGSDVAMHPTKLVYQLLAAGFTTVCYDGQFFFDTDHAVTAADGTVGSVSNFGGGSGTPWFLLDVSRPIKPLIYQERRAFNLTRMDALTDEQVFNASEFRYGVDGRCNAGYGLWQLAYASRQTLNATNYAAARAAMLGMKGDRGVPLNLMPGLLVVPPALEGAAREILMAERDAAGATNVWRNTAELHVEQYL